MEEVNNFSCAFDVAPKAKPRPKHRSVSKRVGSKVIKMTSSYYPGDYMEWQESFSRKLIEAWGRREKLTGPVMVSIQFTFQVPASLSKKERDERLSRKYHFQKPDRDNLDKAVLDAMTKAGIWADDCQVCSGLTMKVWGESPSIGICVTPL